MSVERDLERERRFLRDASPLAPPFRAHAHARLVAGETEYGNSWATRDLSDLLVEIIEECADIGAWAALTDQAGDQHPNLDRDDREALSAAVAHATKLGALAWTTVANARDRLLEIESGADRGC